MEKQDSFKASIADYKEARRKRRETFGPDLLDLGFDMTRIGKNKVISFDQQIKDRLNAFKESIFLDKIKAKERDFTQSSDDLARKSLTSRFLTGIKSYVNTQKNRFDDLTDNLAGRLGNGLDQFEKKTSDFKESLTTRGKDHLSRVLSSVIDKSQKLQSKIDSRSDDVNQSKTDTKERVDKSQKNLDPKNDKNRKKNLKKTAKSFKKTMTGDYSDQRDVVLTEFSHWYHQLSKDDRQEASRILLGKKGFDENQIITSLDVVKSANTWRTHETFDGTVGLVAFFSSLREELPDVSFTKQDLKKAMVFVETLEEQGLESNTITNQIDNTSFEVSSQPQEVVETVSTEDQLKKELQASLLSLEASQPRVEKDKSQVVESPGKRSYAYNDHRHPFYGRVFDQEERDSQRDSDYYDNIYELDFTDIDFNEIFDELPKDTHWESLL